MTNSQPLHLARPVLAASTRKSARELLLGFCSGLALDEAALGPASGRPKRQNQTAVKTGIVCSDHPKTHGTTHGSGTHMHACMHAGRDRMHTHITEAFHDTPTKENLELEIEKQGEERRNSDFTFDLGAYPLLIVPSKSVKAVQVRFCADFFSDPRQTPETREVVPQGHFPLEMGTLDHDGHTQRSFGDGRPTRLASGTIRLGVVAAEWSIIGR